MTKVADRWTFGLDTAFAAERPREFSRLKDLERILGLLHTRAENSAYLPGEAGGQTLYGGSGSGENLTLGSTSHATKGRIYFGASSAYDEVNTRLGINTVSPGATLDVQGSAIFNETGGNFDFRIEGDTEANLFFVDASTDRVGIGTATPGRRLHVVSSTAGDANVTIHNSSATGYSGIEFLNAGGTSSFFFGTDNNAANVRINGINSYPLVFLTQSTERLRLDSSGNYRFGTATVGTNGVGVLSIKNGTAPTTGATDCVQFYSSDNSAGNTIPSWYTEGTEAVIAGSADSASGNRLRVRVNGTVYQILCV